MPAEPKWLTADELVATNASLVPNFFLRDRGLLESAVAAPINAFVYDGETGLVELAVRLLHAVAMAHAFEDGNKRTAYIGATIFLEQNMATVAVPDEQLVGEWVVSLVERRISQRELCRRLSPHIVLPE